MLIAGTLALNIIVISMETASLNHTLPVSLLVIEGIFLSIYSLEFSMKLFVEPVKYWRNYYNIFDVIMLLMTLLHLIVAIIFKDQPNSLVFKIILGKRLNTW